MTNNQQNIIKKLQLIDQGIVLVVFAIVSIGVLALMQQYFTKDLFKTKETLGAVDASAAANSKQLLKIDAPNHLGGHLILFLTIMGFSALVNTMLFAPEILFEKDQIARFTIFEKIIFGFFYLITHFLVIVFGQRLFKGMPPLFIATEKGFYYEPAGIGSGWILWEDITEVRESEVLYGSGVNNGQKFHNYQTEGVGDILIKPSDLGEDYEKVLGIFKSKVKFTIDYRSMT